MTGRRSRIAGKPRLGPRPAAGFRAAAGRSVFATTPLDVSGAGAMCWTRPAPRALHATLHRPPE